MGLLVSAAASHFTCLSMWIPLKSTEEEHGPEKAQKLEEMIVILRKTELKYAKKCAWAFSGLSITLIVLIVVVIAWSTTR